jgi:hypothetical protein
MIASIGFEAWLAVAAVVGVTLLLILRTLGTQVEHETRLHDLKVRSHALRHQQNSRLAEMARIIEVNEAD